MTKQQFRVKSKKMIRDASKCMEERINTAIASGAIDLESYDDDYILPRIFIHAALREATFQFDLLSRVDKHESNNLYKCL